jgi:hypothetical protein
VAALLGESPAQLDGVDVEPLQHVLVDDRKLLDRVVDADRPLFQAQGLAELGIGNGRDARGAVAAEVDRHAIRFPMIQGGEHPFSGRHGTHPP